MLWHDGDVSSAIQEVRRNGATFLVYVHGEDEVSQRMSAIWEDTAVADVLKGSKVVALRINSNSTACEQFSEIYPVVCVPSTFFIGDSGTPLEVIPGPCNREDLITKIQYALQVHSQQQAAAAVTGRQQQTVVGSSPLGVTASFTDSTSQPLPSSDVRSDESMSADGNLEEKVARARELVAKKQTERMQQEQEERRRREEERRQLGKEMARLKQSQAEQSARELADDLKKDKDEEKNARQKVKEQIAKDRADRATRYQKEKEERELEAEKRLQGKLAAQEEERARAAAARSSVARIQFRLPDGSFVTNQFEPSDTLDTARKYLALHSANPLGRDFRLSTSYPRRLFVDADLQSTLADLGLAPTAVLVVLPPLASTASTTGQAVLSSTKSAWSLLLLLVAPLLALWNYIYTFLRGGERPSTSAARGAGSRASSAPPTQPSGNRLSGGERQSSSYAVRSTVRDGRIGRLSTFEDDNDDPNATWNGNSTQQQ